MRLVTALLLVVLACGASASALSQAPPETSRAGTQDRAAETPESSSAPAGKRASPSSPPAAVTDEGAATGKANDRFKPSEEISEDLSVSFPSDI